METIKENIEGRIIPLLEKAGMYYRVFSRVKSKESIQKKLDIKANAYRRSGRKMQDIIGIRVIFYFQEDVSIFYEKLKTMEGYDSTNESNSSKELKELTDIIESFDGGDPQHEKLKRLLPFHDKVFMPERLNLVMRMNPREQERLKDALSEYGDNASLIDATYEVQLRTVLSEGWHEIEHDLRYKTKDETWWDFCKDESRMLNGIYASLETNERALSQMIHELTYKNYNNKSWDAMIRFHLCKRMSEEKLPNELCEILDNDERLAKEILHVTRKEFTNWLWSMTVKPPLSTKFALFLINRKMLNDERITSLEDNAVKVILGGMP